MIKLVLLRHGESVWNKENRFTGWTDVELTKKGIWEAKKAAQILKKERYSFDVVFTSLLKRQIMTTSIVLKKLGLAKIPVNKSWRLNERHYGALQGLNKSEMAAKFGEAQVKIWRRSYDIRPPLLKKTDKRYPGKDPRYNDLDKKDIPLGESLKDTVLRFMPHWKKEIAPAINSGKKVLISGHGNTLRAVVKYLDNVPENKIVEFNIPTGVPLVYELNKNLKPVRHYFLGDKKYIQAKINAIKAAGKAKK